VGTFWKGGKLSTYLCCEHEGCNSLWVSDRSSLASIHISRAIFSRKFQYRNPSKLSVIKPLLVHFLFRAWMEAVMDRVQGPPCAERWICAYHRSTNERLSPVDWPLAKWADPAQSAYFAKCKLALTLPIHYSFPGPPSDTSYITGHLSCS
jgi:hypothetical protein